MLDKTRKELYFKAKRRGLLELDIALGNIADNHLGTMTEDQLKIFSKLLDVQDDIILKWILKQETSPEEFQMFLDMINLHNT